MSLRAGRPTERGGRMRGPTILVLASTFSIACSLHVGTGLGSGPAAGPAEVLAPPTTPLARSSRPVHVPRHARVHVEPQAAQADDSLEQLCVDEINRYRATLGLRPLLRDRSHEACAAGQVAADAAADRMHSQFGRCGEGSQNECWASPGPGADMIKGCLKGMWNEGPGGGHYENMRGDAKSVSCAFYTNPAGGHWSVQDFR